MAAYDIWESCSILILKRKRDFMLLSLSLYFGKIKIYIFKPHSFPYPSSMKLYIPM